jgi:hypothetical protein
VPLKIKSMQVDYFVTLLKHLIGWTMAYYYQNQIFMEFKVKLGNALIHTIITKNKAYKLNLLILITTKTKTGVL